MGKAGVARTICDPTAGTGGMLSVAGEYLEEHSPEARLTMFGQELNPESYAICKADILIKGRISPISCSAILFQKTAIHIGEHAKPGEALRAGDMIGI